MRISLRREKYLFPKDLAKRNLKTNQTRPIQPRSSAVLDDGDDANEREDDDEDCEENTEEPVSVDRVNLLRSIQSANLKDYSNITTNNYSSFENSPFVKIHSEDGSIRLIKKSSIVWYLESGVKKLSNDRRLRVMQSVSFTEQNKHIIKQVEKRAKIQVGDYCVFQCSDNSKFLIGRVISFAFEFNTNKSVPMWEWDAGSRQSEKICALCNLYKAEEVDNTLTGKLIDSDLSIIGFIPAINIFVVYPIHVMQMLENRDSCCLMLLLQKI